MLCNMPMWLSFSREWKEMLLNWENSVILRQLRRIPQDDSSHILLRSSNKFL